MWLLLIPFSLLIFNSSPTSASELHYVVAVPANLKQGTEEQVCVTFLDLKGEADLRIDLKNEDQVLSVAKHKINTHDHTNCYALQVPIIKEDRSIWHLHVSAHGEHVNVDDSKKVVILKKTDVCIIQHDKSTYKPGDTVRFRLMSVNSNFQAINKKYPLVEILDPNNDRIAQWLDVSTTQGFADFSFLLANELTLGNYKIKMPNSCEKSFTVDEYVPKRFELNIKIPSKVALTDKSFHLDACGSYTYGKAVEGSIDLLVCEEILVHNSEEEAYKQNCITIKGEKTDSKGCVSREIQLEQFNFTATDGKKCLQIKCELTEDGTGYSEKASVELHLSQVTNTIEFVECENLYQTGFPYHGKVKVSDEKKQPVANQVVSLYVKYDEVDNHVMPMKLVTDLSGIAQFTVDTSKRQSLITLRVRLSFDTDEQYMWDFFQVGIPEDWLKLLPFYSKSESLLSIQKHSNDVSCNSEQSVNVEYDIHKKNIESDTDHLHFFYIFITESGIFSYKEHKVDINAQTNSQNLHGSFPLNFHIDEEFFPSFSLIVFSVLPNGETIVRVTNYNVSPCVQKKMKLSFSEEQVRPGETVDLEVTADPGSLCSVRSVDKGYLLEKPHDDHYLLIDLTKQLRYTVDNNKYTYLTVEPDVHQCPGNMRAEADGRLDVYSLFQKSNLQILTNTQVKVPMKCVPVPLLEEITYLKSRAHTVKKDPKYFTRSYFPDTWLFELVPVSSDGHSVLHLTTPHTITKWVTDGFCLSKTGFASVKDVELTTFQPYFIDLIVPYSVVQGEKFTVQAVVFSYVKKCIMVVILLSKSEDLVTAQDKKQTRCICEGHSHTFSWDVSALKPKTLKIHVDSGSIEVEGDCTQDALAIEDHRKDSVEKTIVVKPKGYEAEQTKTFLLQSSDNCEAITININAPERLVPGSERAHLIIQGDVMANIVARLDNLFYLPDACAEQNIAKFSRYVYTLEYLESIQELTPEKKDKALQSLIKGYQKQLTFRAEGGCYAYFLGGTGNVWLTAFTVRAYDGAQKYIHINEKHIQQAVNWLHNKQQANGCFRHVGYHYNNYLEADNEITRTAYITIALLEHNVIHNRSIVEDALSCLRKLADSVTSVYTQAVLAYAFSLSGDGELRDQLLKKLDETAIRKEGLKHWETATFRDGKVDTASYVVLALLSEKITTIKNLGDCGDIVRWMLTQQRSWGGFRYCQDKTMALQALTKYAKAIRNMRGDSTVTITSKSGFQKIIHVDKRNNLLVQTVDLPEVPGEYTIKVRGDGFVYVQSHLHYYALPDRTEKGHFSFNVSTEPSTSSHASQKKFNVHMDVRYSGKLEETNMAMIVVDHVSGYVPDKKSVEKLNEHNLVERTEISTQNITIYLRKLTHDSVSLAFSMGRETHVENLQPAYAVVHDYYDPDDRTVVDYSAPCSSDFKKTENY
ncbi:alpha-2-macroglobulin-like [Eleutherodactylus coqui]|uniref:alpha-2-macroglobulin-like n=1 Tax=Eleutherodactylus coqui TaxID=57060 RepID=UPI00346339A8